MSDLYLVAHKVRGEAAFDVATQMECPLCAGQDFYGCVECDSTGHWWIIPTSGHRAFPFWSQDLATFSFAYYRSPSPIFLNPTQMLAQMPEGLPDHYPTRGTPDKPKLDIAALIPSIPIRRRA